MRLRDGRHGRCGGRSSMAVAVFNSNEDTIEMLRMMLEHEGFQTSAVAPTCSEFVAQHRPAALKNCGWLITTTNKEALAADRRRGPD
jgi:hypothetical protein